MAWMLGRELRARRRRDGASMAWTPAAEIAPSPRGRQSSVRAVAALESSYAIDATGHGRNVAYRHAGTATTAEASDLDDATFLELSDTDASYALLPPMGGDARPFPTTIHCPGGKQAHR